MCRFSRVPLSFSEFKVPQYDLVSLDEIPRVPAPMLNSDEMTYCFFVHKYDTTYPHLNLHHHIFTLRSYSTNILNVDTNGRNYLRWQMKSYDGSRFSFLTPNGSFLAMTTYFIAIVISNINRETTIYIKTPNGEMQAYSEAMAGVLEPRFHREDELFVTANTDDFNVEHFQFVPSVMNVVEIQEYMMAKRPGKCAH